LKNWDWFVIFSPQWAVAPRCRLQVVSKELIDQLDRIAQTMWQATLG
jgi:hypothetical protein